MATTNLKTAIENAENLLSGEWLKEEGRFKKTLELGNTQLSMHTLDYWIAFAQEDETRLSRNFLRVLNETVDKCRQEIMKKKRSGSKRDFPYTDEEYNALLTTLGNFRDQLTALYHAAHPPAALAVDEKSLRESSVSLEEDEKSSREDSVSSVGGHEGLVEKSRPLIIAKAIEFGERTVAKVERAIKSLSNEGEDQEPSLLDRVVKLFEPKAAEEVIRELTKKERAFWYTAVIRHIYDLMPAGGHKNKEAILNMLEQAEKNPNKIDYQKLTDLAAADMEHFLSHQPDEKRKTALLNFVGLAQKALLSHNTRKDRLIMLGKGIGCAVAAVTCIFFAAAGLAVMGAAASTAISIFVALNLTAYAIDPARHKAFVREYHIPNLYPETILEVTQKIPGIYRNICTAFKIKDSTQELIEKTVKNLVDNFGVKSLRSLIDDYKTLTGQALGIERLQAVATHKPAPEIG